MIRVPSMAVAAALILASCGTATQFPGNGNPAAPMVRPEAAKGLYEPLAVGDSWKYTCRDIKGGGENGNQPFTIYDKVLGMATVGKIRAYEFSLAVPQVPSKPLKVNTEIMLLTNGPTGSLWIHGYLLHGKVHAIKTAEIVSSSTPPKLAHFDYTGPDGNGVFRFFYGIVPTNKTPLGYFTVADYEEGKNATNDYGYARGLGIAEEDHGPNFEVDCLIEHVVLH